MRSVWLSLGIWLAVGSALGCGDDDAGAPDAGPRGGGQGGQSGGPMRDASIAGRPAPGDDASVDEEDGGGGGGGPDAHAPGPSGDETLSARYCTPEAGSFLDVIA